MLLNLREPSISGLARLKSTDFNQVIIIREKNRRLKSKYGTVNFRLLKTN